MGTYGIMQRSKHSREPYDILTPASDSAIICITKVTQEQDELHAGHPVCVSTSVQPVKLSTHFCAPGSQGGYGIHVSCPTKC